MTTPEIVLHTLSKSTVAEFTGNGILMRNASDALDLLFAANAKGASWMALHEANITPEFFDLRTGVAGDVLQKLVNYRFKLAIVSDISRYTNKSESLAALVRESNRGRDVRFVASMQQLAEVI
jgi:hypothetical protein